MEPSGLDELLQRARLHDPDALAELVDLYSPRLFGLLFRLTGMREVAEDLLQETFLRVVRVIGQYEHVGKFEAWLFRIAANLGRDRARQVKRHGDVSLDAVLADGARADWMAEPNAAHPAAQVEGREDSVRLTAAIAESCRTPRARLSCSGITRSFRSARLRNYWASRWGRPWPGAHRALGHLRGCASPKKSDMSGELENLERTVEREMALLRCLPPVSPRPAFVGQIKAAMRQECGGRPTLGVFTASHN